VRLAAIDLGTKGPFNVESDGVVTRWVVFFLPDLRLSTVTRTGGQAGNLNGVINEMQTNRDLATLRTSLSGAPYVLLAKTRSRQIGDSGFRPRPFSEPDQNSPTVLFARFPPKR
jgi:hypothetical protein